MMDTNIESFTVEASKVLGKSVENTRKTFEEKGIYEKIKANYDAFIKMNLQTKMYFIQGPLYFGEETDD